MEEQHRPDRMQHTSGVVILVTAVAITTAAVSLSLFKSCVFPCFCASFAFCALPSCAACVVFPGPAVPDQCQLSATDPTTATQRCITNSCLQVGQNSSILVQPIASQPAQRTQTSREECAASTDVTQPLTNRLVAVRCHGHALQVCCCCHIMRSPKY